jgi:hypothetical protein
VQVAQGSGGSGGEGVRQVAARMSSLHVAEPWAMEEFPRQFSEDTERALCYAELLDAGIGCRSRSTKRQQNKQHKRGKKAYVTLWSHPMLFGLAQLRRSG